MGAVRRQLGAPQEFQNPASSRLGLVGPVLSMASVSDGMYWAYGSCWGASGALLSGDLATVMYGRAEREWLCGSFCLRACLSRTHFAYIVRHTPVLDLQLTRRQSHCSTRTRIALSCTCPVPPCCRMGPSHSCPSSCSYGTRRSDSICASCQVSDQVQSDLGDVQEGGGVLLDRRGG